MIFVLVIKQTHINLLAICTFTAPDATYHLYSSTKVNMHKFACFMYFLHDIQTSFMTPNLQPAVLSAVKFQLVFSFSLLAPITKSVPPTNLLVPIIFEKVLMYSDLFILLFTLPWITPLDKI